MSQSKKLGLFALGLTATVPAIVLGATDATSGTGLAGSRVDNFMLADQSGMGHELYYYTGSAAIVIVSSVEGDAEIGRAHV